MLPLPAGWRANRVAYRDDTESRADALSARTPSWGTKGSLRILLLRLGFEAPDVDVVLGSKYDPTHHIVEMGGSKRSEQNVSAALKAIGVKARMAPDTEFKAQRALWESLTTCPWWLSTPGGKRVAVVDGTSETKVAKVCAAFVRDLAETLGDPPTERMPIIHRANVLTFLSPEGIDRFTRTVGDRSDLVILTGGSFDEEALRATIAYIMALSSVFPGFILYECVHDAGIAAETVYALCRRAGIRYSLSTQTRHG